MEQCYYCGFQYHPMPVYTRIGAAPHRIHVCHLRVIEKADGEIEVDPNYRECAEKAEADGYVFRPDLTPSR